MQLSGLRRRDPNLSLLVDVARRARKTIATTLSPMWTGIKSVSSGGRAGSEQVSHYTQARADRAHVHSIDRDYSTLSLSYKYALRMSHLANANSRIRSS